jgi:transposase
MSPPRDWREAGRLRAWELKQQGWQQQTIAAALEVTSGAVSQWLKRAATGGVAVLRNRIRPGPRPKLTAGQRARIPALLAPGAEAYGFAGDVWTNPRVVAVPPGPRHPPAPRERLERAAADPPGDPAG